jgi:hypothetical protein
MSWSRHVYSSNVSTIGYDPETQEMTVTWTKGKQSIYSGVPEELAEQLVNAPSVGSMLNAEVKNYYPHRYA